MKRQNSPDFLTWWFVNAKEYRALNDAQEGNPAPLAKFMREHGSLQTVEARQFVAERLEGRKKRRGAKRTVAQQAKEVGTLGLLRDIQKELGCGEHTARRVFLERFPDLYTNDDSLKTSVHRAKAFLKEAFGRVPAPVVQKTKISEPE